MEETRLVFENSKIAVLVNLIIGALTYLAIDSPHYYWLCLIVGVSALRLTFFLWFSNRLDRSLPFRRFRLMLLVVIILQGVGWGIASILLYTTVSDLYKFYLIAIVCGMSGGAIMTLSPSFTAYACFTLPAVLPLVAALLLESKVTFTHAGLMGIVFIIAVLSLAKRINRSHTELLSSKMRLELNAQELAHHKDRLEKIVEERTRELRQSSENYRRLTEEIHDVIFELDAAGDITYISPAVSPVLGYQQEQLTGTSFRSLVCHEDIALMDELFPREYSKNIAPVDFRIHDREGRLHWVRTSSRVIAESSSILGYRGVLGDIEQEKKAEAERAKLMQLYYENQKLESIATLAGGMAHEFNNLLIAIQGHASLLADQSDAAEASLYHLQVIEGQVGKAKGLTAQLLGTASRGKYDPKPLDLVELVVKSALMFERAYKEIRIYRDMAVTTAVVDADRLQLEQVLVNVLVNAREAMPDGGEIHVAVTVGELDASFCGPYDVLPGRFAKVAISDSGVGMEDEIRQRVFDPFFTTKREGRRTGLGLSAAYGIIKNHMGFITVESRPGKGATFTLFLPLSDKKLTRETASQPKVIKGSETILLVDDDKIVVDISKALLERLGYSVVTAESGIKGIEVMTKIGEEIDLVILDIVMPGMDGGETFDRLRQIQPDIPVLLSSGYSIDGQAKEILERGCNGFLQKPFTLAELSQKIREILNAVHS